MRLEEFIDNLINSMIGIMGVRRWNKYIAHPIDRTLTQIERKAEVYGPKIEAYIEAYIEANVEPKLVAALNYIELHVERPIDSMIDTVFAISNGMQNTEIINYGAKALILGAIVEMEDRIIASAEKTDWEGVPDEDYDLLHLGDHVIARETLDTDELDADIVTVKGPDGSRNVSLSKLIGD